MSSRLIYISFAVGLFLLGGFTHTVLAEESEAREITVTGSAELNVEPDQLQFSLWITEKGPLLSKLKALVDQTTEGILRDLAEHDIAEQNIQSYQLQISPEYVYENNKQVQDGFSVTRHIKVVLQETHAYDKIIDLALSRGVTRVGQMQYQISEPAALYQKALTRAFADAQQKAQMIATQAQAKLGAAVRIQEQSSSANPQPMYARAMAEDSLSLPGQQQVSASLAVTFALHDN